MLRFKIILPQIFQMRIVLAKKFYQNRIASVVALAVFRADHKPVCRRNARNKARSAHDGLCLVQRLKADARLWSGGGLARWLTATMLTLSATTGIVLAMKLTGVWGWAP